MSVPEPAGKTASPHLRPCLAPLSPPGRRQAKGKPKRFGLFPCSFRQAAFHPQETMKTTSRLIRWLRTRSFTPKGLWAYRPCMYHASPGAIVEIRKHFAFNRQWDDERIWHNRIVGSLHLGDRAVLKVGDFTVHAGSHISVNNGATLSLGSGYMNHECLVSCFRSISVGDDAAIGPRVVIRDADNHKIVRLSGNGEEGAPENGDSAPIVIGNHVWIGMGATILKGVTIGDGAIVAAGSIVNKDVPPHSLVAGVPARVVKTQVSWRN